MEFKFEELDTILHDTVDAILEKKPDLPLDLIFKEIRGALFLAYNVGYNDAIRNQPTENLTQT